MASSSASSMHTGDTEDRETTVADVIGTFGLALFYAWNFLGLFSSTLLTYESNRMSGAEPLLRFIALGVFTIELFVSRKYVDAFSSPPTRQHILLAAAVLGSIAPALALARLFGVAVPLAAALLGWVAFGATSGPLFLLWGGFSSTLGRSRAMPFTAIAVGGGGILYLLVAYAQPLVGIVVTELLLLVSIGLFMLHSAMLMPFETIEVSTSRARLDLWVKTAFRVTFEGAAFGLLLYYLVAGSRQDSAPMDPAPLIIGSATALAAIILATLTSIGIRRVVPWGTVQRIALPVLVAGFLLMPYLGDTGRIWCAALLVFTFSYYDISNWAILAILAHEYKVQPIYHYSRGRSTILLGITIGWGLGSLIDFSQRSAQSTLVLVSLSVAIALVIVDMLVPHGSDRLAMVEPKGARATSSSSLGSWRRRCVQVAEQYGLSPRESEVFLLLAKGRNAAYIEQTLVISGHTVKTHIYRIYKKLGINTQQELIDVVENASLSK